MANFAVEMHPAVWAPGALRPAVPAVYPVIQLVECSPAVPGATGIAGASSGSTVPTAATHPKSDFTRQRLSIWQPNPKAFAPRHDREEP